MTKAGGAVRRRENRTVAAAVHRALEPVSVTLFVVAASFSAGTPIAQAQDAEHAADTAAVAEVTITGTRIVRDGFEAPTPVTVVGVDQIHQAPMQHISDFVARLPAFGGAMSTTSGGNELSTARQSQNNLNLRGLDVYRTLVLLDGHRVVASDVNGAVNINDLPQSLISRIDVITGGASAAYGSDALAGVVNFILDKEYTGFKTDIQGGTTTHGDNDNYKVNFTYGTQFAGGRGHFIASGEYAKNDGLFGALASRDWGFDTVHIIANPAYNAATGNTSVPEFLVASQASTLLAAPGGLITRGPLRGTMFNQDGSPTTYHYGPLTNSQYNVGGDWRISDVNYYNQTLANRLERQNLFGRVSYQITDDTSVFFSVIESKTDGYARSKLDDSLNNITIQRDNPFLHPDIAAQMDQLGLTSFVMGSFNLDLPYMSSTNIRRMSSYSLGAEGSMEAFGRTWKWNVFGQKGIVRSDINVHVMNKANFARAVDSVRTASGEIVCRVNADASPDNNVPGCVPWNPFGWGQNGPEAIAFVKGWSTLDQRSEQYVLSADISGDPFESWAGPVSVATGVEWREEKVHGTPDPLSLQSAYTAGNFKGTNGSYTVAEAYLETVVPLAADKSWARSLEFNGAVRATDYSTSGYVTTWKAGATYEPFDSLRIRVTRSRDIRAPNLGELFAAGTGGQSPGVLDPWNNNAPLPTFQNQTIGNPDLKPEKADTTGIGVVFQPAPIPGMSVSVDFYDIDVKGAVNTIGAQETLNRCFLGQQEFCDKITRDGSGTITYVTSMPVNVSKLQERGVDIEASYIASLDSLVSSWRGEIALRALGTHVAFLRIDDGVNPVMDNAGDNANLGPLNWRWLFNANYSVGPFTVGWTGRYMSSGHYAPKYVECKANCPVSTPFATTIDNNHIPSRFYHDLSLSYERPLFGARRSQFYLNVMNVLDKQPPPIANANYWYMPTNPQLYDTIGRQFFVGFRYEM